MTRNLEMLWVRVDTQYLSSGELPRYYVRFSLQSAAGEAGSQHGAVCAAVRNDMVFQQSMGGQYGRPRCVYRDISEKIGTFDKAGRTGHKHVFSGGPKLVRRGAGIFLPAGAVREIFSLAAPRNCVCESPTSFCPTSSV